MQRQAGRPAHSAACTHAPCSGVPGAHLLMRIPAGRQAEQADLQYAADLAAWFSKARTDGKVE